MLDPAEMQKLLTPWSYSLYASLPEFMRKQLLIEREIAGSIRLSQIETERLLAHFISKELKQRKADGIY